MNKRIVFTQLGGFPVTQDIMDFLQVSYRSAFSSIATLCGDKAIVAGVNVAGSNVSSGWIAYNNELIPFVGGSVAAKVVIIETTAALTFDDGVVHDVCFTKIATCGVVGDFDFADLLPLTSLINVWLPGDIKMKHCDEAYEAANFDADGYGINREKGWRKLSAAYPLTAGKMLINKDDADATFNEVGKYGGEKSHTLTTGEMPPHDHAERVYKAVADGGDKPVGFTNITGALIETATRTGSTGGGAAHNNMPPYYVILTLIKL